MKSSRSFCCRPGCLLAQIISFVILGLALIGSGVLMRSAILTDDHVDSLICGKLCTPKIGDARYDTFVNSSADPTTMPLMYQKFWYFNLTNHQAFVNGAKPIVQEKGPYTYLKTTLRTGVEFSDDDDTVSYNQMEHYTFVPDRSCADCDPDKDQFVNVNPGVMAGFNTLSLLPPEPKNNQSLTIVAQAFFQTSLPKCPLYGWNMTNGAPNTLGRDGKPTTASPNCPFGWAVPQKLPFAIENMAAETAHELTPNAPFLNISNPLSLFHDYNNWTQAEHALLHSSYGIGGKCILDDITLGTPIPFLPSLANYTRCRVAAASNVTDLQWTVNTGRRQLSQIGRVSKFLGNTTFNIWPHRENPACSATQSPNCQNRFTEVSGSNQHNFQPAWKNPASMESRILEVFNPTLINAAKFKYLKDVSHEDISAKRFAGFEDFPASGLIDGTKVARTKLGMLAPLFFSRAYQADVKNQNFDCFLQDGKTPCEEGVKQLSQESRLNSYIDVEPHTGAVIQGLESAQVNVLVDSLLTSPGITGNPYTKMQAVYLPGLRFEVGAELTPTVADHVRGGIRELKVATFLYHHGAIIFCPVGGLLILAAIYCGRQLVLAKLQSRMDEQQQRLVNAEYNNVSYGTSPAAYSTQTRW